MQSVHLKDCGVQFAYLDSGPPKSRDYATLVCVHGHTHHAQTFVRLFPFALGRNIRIIAINRRDYAGSSAFNDAELALLNSTDELKHRQFLRDRGLEIAYFILWVVNELRIPPLSEDGSTGGLALLGWSLGNITSVAFLAHLATYPTEVTATLEKYLKHFFIYESVFQFLGFPRPPGAYHPLWDPDINREEKAQKIDDWFASFYEHPYLSQASKTRVRELSSLQLRTPIDPVKPPTSANRTQEDITSTTDLAPGMRSEIFFFTNFRDCTLYEQFKVAMVPEMSGSTGFLLPKVKVSVVDGTATVWNIIWASWEMEKDVRKWKDEGMDGVRPVEFVSIEGLNHFALLDDPQLLMKTLANCLAKSST